MPLTQIHKTLSAIEPVFIVNDCLSALSDMEEDSVDCIMTSPPYWGQRQYLEEGIGLEGSYKDYITGLLKITNELKRVLKPSGSFWLNIGDSYYKKSLLGIPWRIALAMTDEQEWTLRNSVIWNKLKGGMDNSKDKLGNVHENVFHFTKSKKYFYDADLIRSKPRQSSVKNGAIVSATGVSGVRYKRQIELSTSLSIEEKKHALDALNAMLADVGVGKISDFRMVIRGQQRTTHSNSQKVSGRAKELQEKGHYFLKYHPKGSKPQDVWDIIPESRQKRSSHCAPFPEDLCKIPILATCPIDGVVLDPFCGAGTTNFVAYQLGRRSIGIDLSSEYIEMARKRCEILL